MSLSERDFESWCFRNGGETYDGEDRPGLTCQFPDTETHDRVAYLSDSGAFEVITDGRFYSTRSLHQNAEAWIGDDDRLHIDTEDTRIAIDPR